MISHVNVERVGPHELLVTWRGPDDAAVFVSASPDDAGTAIVGLDGPRRVLVGNAAAHERHYIHLLADGADFVVAAERLVPLAGTLNFRDIGGYGAREGRRVRWGRVYRSDRLTDLTDADLELLERLGVRSIVDVRGPREHEAAPTKVPAEGAFRLIGLPITDGTVEGVSLGERMETGAIAEFSVTDMTALYLDIVEQHADIFASILTLAAEPEHHALVYHCTAGKDRTGLATAFLLSTLGVDDPVILDDYELTNRYRSVRRVEELRASLAERGIDIERFMPLFTAPRRAMADALDELRRRHGTLERCLIDAGGLDPEVPAALRARLLTPEPAR